MKGTADAVLMFRALHHFSRFEGDGGYFTAALKDTFDVLKPGGIVGVEQHRAPAGNPDAWANGDNGYLKQAAVIAKFEAAGFELVAASELNANARDQPTDKDMVWRLPPTLATSQGNAALKAEMEAIGESDRMTLLFRKPAA
jgi:predicted methyltransferase